MNSLPLDIEPEHAIASSDDEVRTLFISGLPMDIKPRELYLLFRPYKGYVGSLLKSTTKQPVGFVMFDKRPNAEKALNSLNGVRFDPESPRTMRLEFARANTRSGKPRTTPSPTLFTPLSPAIGTSFFPRDPYELMGSSFFSSDPWNPVSFYATDLSSALTTPAPFFPHLSLLHAAQTNWFQSPAESAMQRCKGHQSF
uniref:RRM domain-containing protein n=1 Tax=Eptatretus burgeri TaxID=7764 RepID=A0A8C4NP53_EPTBU